MCWLSCTLDLYFCILYLLPTTCNGGADTVAASCLAEPHAGFVFQSNARNHVQSGFDLIKLNGSASRACRMIYWVWLLWLRTVLVLPQTGESLLPSLCVGGSNGYREPSNRSVRLIGPFTALQSGNDGGRVVFIMTPHTHQHIKGVVVAVASQANATHLVPVGN